MRLRDYQLDLIEGARRAMAQGHRRVLIVAPCGAGKTVLASYMAGEHAGRGGKVLFLAHRHELLEQTRDTFQRAGVPMAGVEVMSVQTAARRADKLPGAGYTMLMLDECHHAAAGQWRKVLEALPGAWAVGLTATPCRLDGQGLDDIFPAMVEGITTGELIARGYLAPYRCFTWPLIDRGKLRVSHGEYRFDAQLLSPKVVGDAAAHYLDICPGKQAICYCGSIEASRAACAAFRAAGVEAAHLDGDTPAGERAAIVAAFRVGEIRVLTNVDLLGEGFDVPACDAAILLRPTKSLSLHIQQSMRCMRPGPGKTAIIIDHVGNILAHGLPDEVRSWSLSGKPKREASGLRKCPHCGLMNPAEFEACALCGLPLAGEMVIRTGPEYQEGQLRELDRAAREAMRQLREREARRKRQEEGQCRSYEDFLQLAQERGYKAGWAYHKAKARGYAR